MAADAKPRFFRTPEAFGKWLAANHTKAPELLVGYWKVDAGKPSMTWPQSVEQALRFGWIDGVRRSLGADAYCIRFTPRRPGSHWSLVNVRIAKRLAAEGRMAPAGLAAFKERSSRNMGKGAYAQRTPAPMPADCLRRLKADKKAWAGFNARPPWYQRSVAWWLADAKREETRERRFAKVLAASRAGQVLDWAARPRPAHKR